MVPVSSSLKAEPVPLSTPLLSVAPLLRVSHSCTYGTQVGDKDVAVLRMRWQRAVGSGGTGAPMQGLTGVAVCRTGARAQPLPMSERKLESKQCMGNIPALKLESIKTPLAT